MRSPLVPGPGVHVFAVEPTTAQLVGRDLLPGPLAVAVDGTVAQLLEGGRTEIVELAGLRPGSRHEVTVLDRRGRTRHRLVLQTPEQPAGPEVARFATISDLHLGQRRFFGVEDESGEGPASMAFRATRAAIAEAIGWGASIVLVKGDVTSHNRPEEWDLAAGAFSGWPVPVVVTRGNHDVRRPGGGDLSLGALAAMGQPIEPVVTHRLPGLRLLLCDTTIEGRTGGDVRHLHERVLEAAGPDHLFIAVHHHVHQRRAQTFHPAGIDRQVAANLVRSLLTAERDVMISSGHSHRNRCHVHGPVVATEVASTSDYPGVWAGYVVHEGGLRQVVRRIVDDDVVAWSERCRSALGGVWSRWTEGAVPDRCPTWTWRRVPAGSLQPNRTS